MSGIFDPENKVMQIGVKFADLLLINHGIKTHEQVTRERGGGDWEENVEQLRRENELLKTIENESGVENIGLTITIDIFGNVTNPKITHVEMGESIEIGHTGNPLALTSGDKIIITTHKNNKHVYLISNNTTTEINAYLSEDSEFLQIMSGDNTFGYSAGSGESNMAVTISFKYRYAGV